jgi:NADH dehydrogenase [ubiquinone] 1 alpha subcomplex assembly factor 6
MSNDADIYCEEQVRRFDRDRWLTTLFAPADARPDLLALYAFNVEVARIRELVREPMMGVIRLHWWRETIEEIAAGNARLHPVAVALAEAWGRRKLPRELFESILTARELDLGIEPSADLGALEAYAAGTGGAITRLALAVLGADGEAAAKAGQHVGIAWTLTGLLRAAPFHAVQRRIFLPRDLLEQHGVDVEAFCNGRPAPAVADVVKIVAVRASEHLVQARALRKQVPRAAISPLLPGVIANLHLRRLARTGHAVFDPSLQRPAGSTAVRLAIASVLGRY